MNYPMPAYHFIVEWGGSRVGMIEVSGLGGWADVISNRDSASAENSPFKLPGLVHYQNIVFKRALMKGDNEFFQWFNTIAFGKVERRDILISLLDEHHSPVVRWKVKNAWPVKIDYAALRSCASDMAIEILELAHEGMTVENS